MAPSADERLDGDAAEAFLLASFAVARRHALSPTWFEATLAALAEAVAERPEQPAPALVLDLVPLLSGERLVPHAVEGDPALTDALRGWEDHVLARLVADRRFQRLVDGVATLPKALRPVAAGVAAVRLLERLGVPGGVGLSAALVRRFSGRPLEEVAEAGRAALADERARRRVVEGLVAVARAARRAKELLSDAEVFLVENIAALKGLGPRVALAQLAGVAQTLEEALPNRLRLPPDDGDATTSLEEESAYPVGGFASLATSGSMENLVTSELIYMDEAGAPRPDLFDVRFVEGELLYYARDESVAVRRRRVVVLVLDPSLVDARVLDAGEAVQRAVWLLGALAAIVRRLASWLDGEALTFEVVSPASPAEDPLAEEREVLALLLREYRERGQLEVGTAASSAEAIRRARLDHKGRARVLLIGTRMPGGLEGPAQPEAFVDVSAPRPVVHWIDGVRPDADAVPGAQAAFAALARQLLVGLLHPPRATPSAPVVRAR